ncbi:MAG: hypothetical protein KDD19_10815 [Phaeodactylibacter sp.]|nr:hypothetical protein [Phaeodactylibacter sp.]MCB9050048.1 hypothetical protein [Lewinellaceae bacterium]
MKRLLAILVLFCCLGRLAAQQADTTVTEAPVDTVIEKQKKENWFNRDYPNPKRAALLSLAIPGAGQLYNKRWWKVPLVYGALTGMVLVVDYNQSLYRRLRDALNLKRQGEEHEFTGTTLDNLSTLRSLRDSYDKNTQTAYVGIVLVYTLQAMEAFVDAHLKGFDVNDDLSLRVKPNVEFIAPLGQPVMGIGVSIPLNGKPLQKPERNLVGR